MIKNGCCQSVFWTLKLIVSQELADVINWIFSCCYKFTQIERWLKIFGLSMTKNWCDQSGDRTLKLMVPEEWTDGINQFFAYWYKFTKVKSWSKIFWVGIVKNGCDQFGLGDSKIDYISKMNRWNKLIFCMLIQIQEN